MPENYKISDAEFGAIVVQRSRRAHRVLFKVKNGALVVVVPAFSMCSDSLLLGLVEQNREALRRLLSKVVNKMSDVTLYDGKVIPLVEGELRIVADEAVGVGNVRVRQDGTAVVFAYNPANDVSEQGLGRAFSRFILRHIATRYGGCLRAMVVDYACRYGLTVKEVRIGRGSHTLGHCSRSGVITISAYVLFFPQHLRQYIVCHELAHLTHFDHSAAFHRLCNEYCQGNETLWRREVRQFRFPISL